MECDHKTPKDHQNGYIGDRINWVCSNCKKESVWTVQYSSYGKMECAVCCYPDMDFVACSEECAKQLK